MTKPSRSPDRNTFQRQQYLERCAAEGRTPENDADVRAMTEYYDRWEKETLARESEPTWKESNLKHDLRTTDWMLSKVRGSDSYAQNLYAAMCNNEFQRTEVWPVLKGETWSCTWRYAGGIIADMREEGDYIDWYCSGMAGGDEPAVYLRPDLKRNHYVPEGHITDEILTDLARLGWQAIDRDE